MSWDPVTCDEWQGLDLEVIASCFAGPSNLEGAELVYARYDGDGYHMQAMVVYWQDGQYWWVAGSHCSCNALNECGWDPEPWTDEATEVGAAVMAHRAVKLIGDA